MIGDAYFDLREQLGTDLFKLAQLVQTHGGTADDSQILSNLIASLNDPFVFVVAGEVNVGKSTFLNALFGAEFSRTGVMPTTDKIKFFKHGPVHATVAVGPTIDEVRVPLDFLKNYHVVDTPGTNSIEHEHQQITERFVPIADLVVFVFSAMNPWGASAWQFLEKVHRQWMKHVIFVLQQCDLRTAEEIQVITDYMRQLSQQRFGREFPLFPISGKKAYLARTSGLDADRLLNESGFLDLEHHIDEVVTKHPNRLTKFGSALRIARQVLDKLIDRSAARLEELHRHRQLIDEMQAERSVQAQRTQTKLEVAIQTTVHDYAESAGHMADSVDACLAVKAAFGAMREDTRMPQNLDHRLYQELMTRAGERWHQMATVLEDDFKRFENYMSHHWRGELYLSELRGKDDVEPASEEARRRFIAKIDSTLRRFVLGLKIQETLAPGLVRSRKQARLLPWLVLPMLLGSGAAFYWLGWQMGAAVFGSALLLTVLLLLLVRAGLRGTRAKLAKQLDTAREGLREMLRSQVVDETEHAFGLFTRILLPARQALETEEMEGSARTAELQDLRESFVRLKEQMQESGWAG